MKIEEIETVSDLRYIIWRGIKAKKYEKLFAPKAPKCVLGDIQLREQGDYVESEIRQRNNFEPDEEDFLIGNMFYNKWLKQIRFKDRELIEKRCLGYGWKRLSREFGCERTIKRHYRNGMKSILDYIKCAQ